MIEAGKVRLNHVALAAGPRWALTLRASSASSWCMSGAILQKHDHGTDHRVWQDVYRPTTPVGEVYLKLTAI